MTDARTLGAAGTALIHKWEGCGKKRADGRFDAYPDPGSKDGKPWTIGWGSTGPDVVPGLIWTQPQCDARFGRDIVTFVNAVAKVIGSAPTTPAQFDALVSFHYNTGAIASATLTKMHIAGRFEDAADQFARWIYNDGKPMAGLKSRRAEEAALYASAIPVALKQPMPFVQADIRVVNARSGLNVRSRASVSSEKLSSLALGAPVTVIQDTGDWVRIMYQGGQGWVNDQYLTAA